MFKNINWKNVAVIALVSLVVVKVVYPFAQPYLSKVPVLGAWFKA